jgi:glycosyltransferase involved in cell wall biosynthesis
MANGLVSTIIPVYNRAGLLREATASVLAQTYRPIEVLIVDDGSTDDTAATCRELADTDPDVVRVLRQDNAGPGAAREAGRRAARGEFIQYLDSDDRLLPAKFERQVAALLERPECGVAYCFTRYHRMGEAPHAEPWKGSGRTVETMFPTFLDERWWDTPTPLYRREVCDRAGPWSDLRLEEDWEYDCRIAALGTRLVHCREFLVEVRDHGDGLCHGSAYDPERLRHRVRAHRLIYAHARRAGIAIDDHHMQRFARKLFLLARQCGAAGLAEQSRTCFGLAREASGPQRSRGFDFHLYRAAAAGFGWCFTGRLSCWADGLRSSPPRGAQPEAVR